MSEAEISLADSRKSYPVSQQETIYQGQVFGFQTDLVQLHPDEPPARRDFLQHPGAVAIVPLRQVAAPADDPASFQVLLVKQYRHPIGARLWEVPAGLLDQPGEDRLAAAKRELWEETGLQAQRWDVLVDFFTSPGCSTEHLRVFLARQVTVAAGSQFQREAEERDFQLAWFSLPACLRAIRQGQLHNPSAMVGLLAAYQACLSGWQGLRPVDAPFQVDPTSAP